MLEVTEETGFTNGGTGSTETKRRGSDGQLLSKLLAPRVARPGGRGGGGGAKHNKKKMCVR